MMYIDSHYSLGQKKVRKVRGMMALKSRIHTVG